MLSLSIDTALQRCTVAVARSGALVSVQTAGMEKGHAEHLAPMAATALREAGVTVRDLDRIGVTVGPGGFTGVRVGLAFARGLVLGVRAHAVGVSTLAALAAGARAPGVDLIAPVIDARRGEVYAALYSAAGEEILAPFVAAPEAAFAKLSACAAAALLCGSGVSILAAHARGWPQAAAASQIDAAALAALVNAAPAPDGPPAPLYLRAPDAKPPKASPFAQ